MPQKPTKKIKEPEYNFQDLTEGQKDSMEMFALSLLEEFLSLGLDQPTAKQCAIKSIRHQIEELQLIDDIHLVGLKKRMDLKRYVMLILSDI